MGVRINKRKKVGEAIKLQQLVQGSIAVLGYGLVIVSVVTITIQPLANAAQPFFRVEDGDVSAGQGIYDGAGLCQDDDTATIKTYNKSNNSGSGSMIAALANGTIEQFSSGTKGPGSAGASSLNVPGGSPKNLTFANEGSGAGSTTFGGGLGQSGCVPNYYEEYKQKAENATPYPAIGGPIVFNGTHTYFVDATKPVAPFGVIPFILGEGLTALSDTVLNTHFSNPITLAPGANITIVVNGDVDIFANVLYDYTRPEDIPKLTVIANGNIYIHPSVTEVHGFLIAQPTGTDKGRIFTCGGLDGPVFTASLNAYFLTHPVQALLLIPRLLTDPVNVLNQIASELVFSNIGYDGQNALKVCSTRPLKIYGALSSYKTVIGRTVGDLNQPNQPAEQIIYSPEVWVSGTQTNPGGSVVLPQGGFDSITSLPPIL